ncbi:MAG: hypothetical protein A3C47_01730 [Omnitrophica bacterium RIFCSPHIGHO2_02_FULL_51_18]|nr:MAG: hypothetical protein A3C47_01730 [Omnitrophica bacterium RIFCSPHIGHO2_02_FULL_51_18]
MTKVVRELRKDKTFHFVDCAYLEITSPSIPAALRALVKKGVQEINILPYFLLSGRHIKQDIPRIVREAKRVYKYRVKIKLCRYLGYDPRIMSLVKQRIREGQ